MDKQDKDALTKTLEDLKAAFLDIQEAIVAMHFVVECLCAELPLTQGDSIQKRLQSARAVLTATGELMDKNIAQRLTAFEAILARTTTPTPLH